MFGYENNSFSKWEAAMTSGENANVLLYEYPKKIPVSFTGPITLYISYYISSFLFL